MVVSYNKKLYPCSGLFKFSVDKFIFKERYARIYINLLRVTDLVRQLFLIYFLMACQAFEM